MRENRVKQLLKIAGRAMKLRCVSVQPLRDDAAGDATATSGINHPVCESIGPSLPARGTGGGNKNLGSGSPVGRPVGAGLNVPPVESF